MINLAYKSSPTISSNQVKIERSINQCCLTFVKKKILKPYSLPLCYRKVFQVKIPCFTSAAADESYGQVDSWRHLLVCEQILRLWWVIPKSRYFFIWACSIASEQPLSTKRESLWNYQKEDEYHCPFFWAKQFACSPITWLTSNSVTSWFSTFWTLLLQLSLILFDFWLILLSCDRQAVHHRWTTPQAWKSGWILGNQTWARQVTSC